MRRLLVAPILSAAVVAGVAVTGAAAGAGSEPGHDVAKTTIGPGPTPAPPTAPLPTAPAPTLPVPTVPLPTIPLPTGAVPTTEPAGLGPESQAIALSMFGLDLARLQCIDAALPQFNDDDALAAAALQGCGAPLMPILRGMVDVAQRSGTFLDPTATTVALPPVPGAEALPREDAFYVGFLLLLQPEEVSCLATGLAGATTEDDSIALAIFERCGVSLSLTLDMLMFALVGDFDDDSSDPVTPATSLDTTIPGTPTTALSIDPNDPVVDVFQEMLLEQQGITLSDEQAACLLSNIEGGDIDTQDMVALFAIMESCGIALTDLVPSG